MRVYLDSDTPKPLEQRVEEAFLKKLYVKSDVPQVTVDRETFSKYMFGLIKAVAKVEYDVEKAVELALPNNLDINEDLIRKQYQIAVNEFSCEIDSYITYIDYLNDDFEDDEIVDVVYTMLNSDETFIEKKLNEIVIQSLQNRTEDNGYSEKIGHSREELFSIMALQIKIIATCDNIMDAVEELESLTPDLNKLKGAELKAEIEKLTKFSEVVNQEISAYKMALNLQSQNAEIPMIIATTKQLLNL